ncbi:hypothetical protein EW145_g7894 [Phellinidium pouzarii]|uniref:Mak10 subunit, NatC N(Alpha)-terminal acetyltransferase n=1 Tax=Phellinidium pouzarii TaxID=167371 RepID=A0A4S4KCX8_9AGAM|nr:hypothetical protein EW145_g7894 [Phellinidium pouzarii]
MDFPGGPHFNDVTHLFDEASEDLALGELLMVEGFSLNEAMSAVEIGDPRMDSGATLPTDTQRPKFDPLTPLLPEEVCWILDRTLACEMHWHAGNALAQTVFTYCVTKFELAELPIELVTVVLRAGVIGMVKCCDLAYRELSKGNVHDCEDWQGEKSEIPLYESVLPQQIASTLEEAETWLMSDKESSFARRVNDGTAFFALDLPLKTSFIPSLLAEARRLLDIIIRREISPPHNQSSVHSAFDPRITRQLHSIMPMRPLVLPLQEESWEAVRGLLDGWEYIYMLSNCDSLLAWNRVGLLRASTSRWTLSRLPFVRSVAQNIFSNGAGIMDRFSIFWLVERFLLEIAHISLGQMNSLFENRPFHTISQTCDEFHNTLSRFLLQHIWASYHNRPRQRRHGMKTAFDWHAIYDAALSMTAKISPRDASESRILKCIPLAVLHWRAGVIRDIILAGFELELYALDERPFAYWYLSQLLGGHENILRELLDVVPQGSPAHSYLTAQGLYVTLLKEMSCGCFIILCHRSVFDAARRWTNFTVRYKWALRPEFASISTPDPFLPDYRAFLHRERAVICEEESTKRVNAVRAFECALRGLVQLRLSADQDPSLQLCRADFVQRRRAPAPAAAAHHGSGAATPCWTAQSWRGTEEALRLVRGFRGF